ncbi:MAG TPA: PAS domain S-box protein, partial [Blastocatellia bacterium]|nr:PAS domain S-box protein [Blastocatellia bacterium]
MSNVAEQKPESEKLRQSEAYFRLLFEFSTDGITLIEPDGRVLHSSPSIADILGYDREEFQGSNVFQLVHPADWAELRDELKRVITEPGARAQIQFRNQRKDGLYVWVDAMVRNLLDEPNIQALVITYRDISKRKQFEDEITRLNAELEYRVAERTTQLENANRELEAFSYSVSHDLRAPLRAIDGFTKILLEECDDKLDDESRRHLIVISNNARQMGMLINDLLAFSRLGRQKTEP